jgi:hypothetical protein
MVRKGTREERGRGRGELTLFCKSIMSSLEGLMLELPGDAMPGMVAIKIIINKMKFNKNIYLGCIIIMNKQMMIKMHTWGVTSLLTRVSSLTTFIKEVGHLAYWRFETCGIQEKPTKKINKI